MICGESSCKAIQGIEKLLDVNHTFSWNRVRYIERMEYSIDLDEYAEPISNLKIDFLIEVIDNQTSELVMQFEKVSGFSIKDFGGSYNQILGFEIIDQSEYGWDQEQRYHIRDYENGSIEFYCKSVEIVSV